MINQIEMERIRENMKRLEENHKLSLVAIQAADRNEIKRLQNTIERLKQEFTILLEEEKLGLSENEQKSADLVEMLERGNFFLYY